MSKCRKLRKEINNKSLWNQWEHYLDAQTIIREDIKEEHRGIYNFFIFGQIVNILRSIALLKEKVHWVILHHNNELLLKCVTVKPHNFEFVLNMASKKYWQKENYDKAEEYAKKLAIKHNLVLVTEKDLVF